MGCPLGTTDKDWVLIGGSYLLKRRAFEDNGWNGEENRNDSESCDCRELLYTNLGSQQKKYRRDVEVRRDKFGVLQVLRGK